MLPNGLLDIPAYHRGQIAMLVRAAGGEPAATEFVFWSREPAGGGEWDHSGVAEKGKTEEGIIAS